MNNQNETALVDYSLVYLELMLKLMNSLKPINHSQAFDIYHSEIVERLNTEIKIEQYLKERLQFKLEQNELASAALALVQGNGTIRY